MQNHPLTSMTDANIIRVHPAQTQSRVGLIKYDTIVQGIEAIRQQIAEFRDLGVRIAVTDTTSNQDLLSLGESISDLKLVTGSSGLAPGLRPDSVNTPSTLEFSIPVRKRAILAGSYSKATLAQIEHAKAEYPSFQLRPFDLHYHFAGALNHALSWAREHLNQGKTVLIYSSSNPVEVSVAQTQLGLQHASELVEQALSELASYLAEEGVRQFIVAGGETSGALALSLTRSRFELYALAKKLHLGFPGPWV
jgi:3-dehydrotetronate 4-kinase